jgi:hypothetical protein
MSKAKTVDVGAWKSHRESWYEKLERYRKEMDIVRTSSQKRKMQLILNNMDICRFNIDICDIQIKIAELQQQNTKLKTNLM